MNIFSGLGHSWQNVVNANGVNLTIIGMLIVFISMAFIVIVIALTPGFLKLLARFLPEEDEHASGNGVRKVSETDVVAAISAVLCHTAQPVNKQD